MRFFGLVFLLLVYTQACRETRSLNSSELSDVASSADVKITEAESDRMLAIIKAKIERGEELSDDLTRVLQMILAVKGPDRKWKGLVLTGDNQRRLLEKRQTYEKLYRSTLDRFGFVEGCEGLLFTSILVASGLEHSLLLAESKSEPGRWYRSASQDCYTSGKSRSSMDRNAFLGLALGLGSKGNAAALDRIISYSQAKNGVLGDAADSLELQRSASMNSQVLALLSEMLYRVQGPSLNSRAYVPEKKSTYLGVESHFLALRIYLKALLYGGVIESDFAILSLKLKSEPQNALLLALYHGLSDGSGDEAALVLLDTQYFPDKTLPTSSQRCEAYLWQKEAANQGWVACPEKSEVYPAVDFFFVQSILSGNLPIPQ